MTLGSAAVAQVKEYHRTRENEKSRLENLVKRTSNYEALKVVIARNHWHH